MKVAFYTQVSENYGAHGWDGVTGECPQYWKAKGGDTYIITGLSINDAISFASTHLEAVAARIECNDNYFRETILDWEILDDAAELCFDDGLEPIELELAA